MPADAAAYGYLDLLMWAIFPYVALILFFYVTIHRYRRQAFSYSSLSSQFLENREHFWGMVPFHYGILVVLAGHVVAFLVPSAILWWNARPLRLWILEISALVFGVLTLVGLVALVARRVRGGRLKPVTTFADWLVLGLLLLQVGTGIAVAVVHGWGSSWFATTLSPYLWSVLKLNPDIAYVTPMPLLVKAHVLGNFLLIAVFPFTRLVHVLVVPNMYLWRKTQVVRWYGIRRGPRAAPGAAPRGR